jgi:hypothetical protein
MNVDDFEREVDGLGHERDDLFCAVEGVDHEVGGISDRNVRA